MGSISVLPDDVLRCIFARCSAKTIASLECTCRRFRSIGKQTPVQLHVTQANEDRIVAWAAGRTVTKMTTRRVWRFAVPETLLVLDSMYAKVSMPHLGAMRYLQRLRIHHVRMPEVPGGARYPVFKLSSLPDSLVDVDIAFDASCRRVDVDGTKKIRVLSIGTYPQNPPGFPRQPDILVTGVDGDVVKLALCTRGGITVVHKVPTKVESARIECEDNRDPGSVMKLFGQALDTLVLIMPRASVVWSEDFATVDPRVLAVDVDFAAIDVVGPNLRTLEVRVDRLAYVYIPDRVGLWACIRNTVVDPAFFRV